VRASVLRSLSTWPASSRTTAKWHCRNQTQKLALINGAPKTVNNVLTVLSTLLKAMECGDLDRVPCTIELLPDPKYVDLSTT
jgi:hypothetical protein